MAIHCSLSQVITTILIVIFSLLQVSYSVSPTSADTVAILSELNNETDWHALLSFKSMISSDPRRSLPSWNYSVHFCLWTGVTCSGSRHPQRVVSLNLSSCALNGRISPTVGNLTFLRRIDLSNNQLHGPIPEEIGDLSRLQHLDLSMNSLQGGIPSTLSHCSQLQNISMHDNEINGEIPPSLGNGCLDLRIIMLRNNSLTGRIPPSLANLSSLSYLDLGHNQLSGVIPPDLGNLDSLTELYLFINQLSGGIPPTLGKLSKIEKLYLPFNNLQGTIPSSIWNLSSLSYLCVASNNLSGVIPMDAFKSLPLLVKINLYENQFHGPIPLSLSNASHLQFIQLDYNMFSGTIPANLGKSLPNLQWLNLQFNQLEARGPDEWKFLTNIANCTNLNILSLGSNKLTGILPQSIANLSSNLQSLTIQNNKISGNIPPEIGNLRSLTVLDLSQNLLEGLIPASIGVLQNLTKLQLSSNKLSGEIPSTLGNLAQLTEVSLGFNELSGTIPTSLGKCQNLNLLNLESNLLSGSIPKDILTIDNLNRGLRLASNRLTGSLPVEVGSLRNIEVIDLSRNKLFGAIPSSLGFCQVLQVLSLSENFFQGSIPTSVGLLKGIQVLDFSQNNFSGRIPDFFQHFHDLQYLNLSYNNFEGEVPRLGIFEKNATAVSVIGNNKLCGGNPEFHLPACSSQSPSRKHTFHALVAIIAVAISFMFLFTLFVLLFVRGSIRKSRGKSLQSESTKEQHVRVSYNELVRATNGFSTENLVGEGSVGAVYKGILNDVHGSMKLVAVKVLNLQIHGASKSFLAECNALRNIRHRNLVKILTTCSSADFRGNNFKAVVFEFMENGCLDDWLHPKENEQVEPKKLNLLQRLNIAIDVASALDYLHHYSEEPIIHCDLKPSNILLDDDMTAHVGDFGLARFVKKIVSKSSQYSTSSAGLKGTIGYVPPEYGMANKVSTCGDVYSYGILLLEMFTAKRPTDDFFMEGLSLRKFVEMAFPERVKDVIDPHLLLLEDATESKDVYGVRVIECIASMLSIGILCASELPAERMEMGNIVRKLNNVRDILLKN